jgi:hypothetical protein
MTSYDVKDHGTTAPLSGQAKKPWVTPSLQMIAVKSAERGPQNTHLDSGGGHIRFRS